MHPNPHQNEFDEETCRRRLEAYRALDTETRRVLQVMSVIYQPVPRSPLVECINRARVLGAHRATPGSLRPLVRSLERARLVHPFHGNTWGCDVHVVEQATRDALSDGTLAGIVSAMRQDHKYHADRYCQRWYNATEAMRELRICVYLGDVERYNALLDDNQSCPADPLSSIGGRPFDRELLPRLAPEFAGAVLQSLVLRAMYALAPRGPAHQVVEDRCASGDATDLERDILAESLLLQGALEKAEEVIAPGEHPRMTGFAAWIAFVRGDNDRALDLFRKGLKNLRRWTGKRAMVYTGGLGQLFVLALLKDGSAKALGEGRVLLGHMERSMRGFPSQPVEDLKLALELRRGPGIPELPGPSVAPGRGPSAPELDSLSQLLQVATRYWLHTGAALAEAEALAEPLGALAKRAEQNGYLWVAREAAELLARLQPDGKAVRLSADRLRARCPTTSIADTIAVQEPWRRKLEALLRLTEGSAPAAAAGPTGDTRMIWLIRLFGGDEHFELEPREQKIRKNGSWSVGRPVALKRLFAKPESFPYLTDQDRQVCATITQRFEAVGYYRRTNTYFDFDPLTAPIALVDHPRVFLADAPGVRVQVSRGRPELVVSKRDGGLSLELAPAFAPGQSVALVRESATRLRVVQIDEHVAALARLVDGRMDLPQAAEAQLSQAVARLSSFVTVQSDIAGQVVDAELVEADATPHVLLVPCGDGLAAEVLVRPFGDRGSYYRPGSGGAQVISQVDGKRERCLRDLAAERRSAEAVLHACPSVGQLCLDDGQWRFEDPEDCLALLFDLQAIGERVVIEWPKGERFRIRRSRSPRSLRLSIKRARDWFSVSGELEVDQGLTLDMSRVLEALGRTPSRRFVPLGDGEFLALTRELWQRLSILRSVVEQDDGGLRVHRLAATSLKEACDGLDDVSADRHWKAQSRRIDDALALEPAVPPTLRAELRPYQAQGYRWLVRLSHLGAGACLADDMGLGKTVQALALLLARAAEGPALVVAPTSVSSVWREEARRFAPTLRMHDFATGDRGELLEQAGPFDVVVCTYGLVANTADLAAKPWHTVVLDEAQAVKNRETQRSKAIMRLQGELRIVTTGTPIENHLGELWNLFRFINPGLLGSFTRFSQRFAGPIERGDPQAREALKRTIQPFVLRRRKDQVLAELPPKTEIELAVELTPQERAVYEAVRQRALARLEVKEDAGRKVGQHHIEILAEITRLRRACCDPRLVVPDCAARGSKLAVLGDVLDRLLAGGHKALVFSQFVDQLQHVRRALDKRGISFQYLDGKTPAAERQRRVTAFQRGEGDVFLISLKAGGLGLNLTAADYVIHLDPWWNPAAEDQASDRAHRIGQSRPVTVYRLVARDTIEERIVELHRHKRDLAHSLLSGTDVSGRLSTQQLLELMRASG